MTDSFSPPNHIIAVLTLVYVIYICLLRTVPYTCSGSYPSISMYRAVPCRTVPYRAVPCRTVNQFILLIVTVSFLWMFSNCCGSCIYLVTGLVLYENIQFGIFCLYIQFGIFFLCSEISENKTTKKFRSRVP